LTAGPIGPSLDGSGLWQEMQVAMYTRRPFSGSPLPPETTFPPVDFSPHALRPSRAVTETTKSVQPIHRMIRPVGREAGSTCAGSGQVTVLDLAPRVVFHRHGVRHVDGTVHARVNGAVVVQR